MGSRCSSFPEPTRRWSIRKAAGAAEVGEFGLQVVPWFLYVQADQRGSPRVSPRYDRTRRARRQVQQFLGVRLTGSGRPAEHRQLSSPFRDSPLVRILFDPSWYG